VGQHGGGRARDRGGPRAGGAGDVHRGSDPGYYLGSGSDRGGFAPTDDIRETIRKKAATFPASPDLSHPPLRTWLETVPPGKGYSAAFETRMWFSPGGATGAIQQALKQAGYEPLARAKRFRVAGMYGPLKAGEIERARNWGAQLARDLRK
jgi:hypothetical protein